MRLQMHGICEQACEQPPVLEVDPTPPMPPMEVVEIVYPKIRLQWSLFGTRKKARDDGKD